MLFSDSLTPFEGELPAAVSIAISEIEEYFEAKKLKVFSWHSGTIVVAASFNVSLPSRGSINNFIRAEEPILVRISLKNYPEQAPAILSDRKDFPKNNLPHLYYTPEGEPAVLCLVRDSLNQWFATVTMADFLLVGSQWFYKAAIGKLLDDNDEFDPVRLEKNTAGKHIYKYTMLSQIVENDERLLPKFPMALMLSCLYKKKESDNFTFKSITAVPLLGLSDIKETTKKALRGIYSANDSANVLPLSSLLVWDPNVTVENQYSTNLPTNYGQLKQYLSFRGINIADMLKGVDKGKALLSRIVPVIHAVRRPKKLIGYPEKYEFFTYVLYVPEGGLQSMTDDAEISILSHTEPFSSELAQTLSNEKRIQSSLYVGVGSLGSKILLHDARTGKNKIGAVDNDKFEQHNLARHSLFSRNIGDNKAEAIIDEIKEFYELETTVDLVAFPKYVSELSEDEIREYDNIIDTTASQQVMQHFAMRNLPDTLRYSRCELVDDGQIGLLYKEGAQRNPRIDDLFYTACYLSNEDDDLHIWRRNDADREPTVLNIGLGCNSITTVMADDLISFHASAFSQLLANENELLKENSGLLYLNICRRSSGFPAISNKYFRIDAFEVLECQAKSGWQLRLFPGTTRKLLRQCKKFGSKETGGILIGVANYKTKVIYVFDIVPEPGDSHGTPVAFTRGIRGLPELVDQIKYNTGEIIGYIGEWHTHPMNLEKLSGQDIKTIGQLQAINKKTPIPTCAVIVTPSKVIPFVYE